MNILVYNKDMPKGRTQLYPYDIQKIEDALNDGKKWREIAQLFWIEDKNGKRKYPAHTTVYGWVRRHVKIKLVKKV